MGMTEGDRLRSAVRRRMAELKVRTLEDLAERADVKVRTLNSLLAGQPTRAEDAVELALGWTRGSIRRLREGGEADLETGDDNHRSWSSVRQSTRDKLREIVERRAAELGRPLDKVLAQAAIPEITWQHMTHDESKRLYYEDLDRLDEALAWHAGSLRLQVLEDVDAEDFDFAEHGVEVPVGAGVDPELLAELADLDADRVREVIGYIRGIKSRGQAQT